MKLELTTPALLFTAISLLISAYSARFLHLAQLLRQLDERYRMERSELILVQIRNLSQRVSIIRYSQIMGGVSFFLCTLSMFLLFRDKGFLGEIIFGASLIALMVSLLLMIVEVHISVKALTIQLNSYEEKNRNNDCSL